MQRGSLEIRYRKVDPDGQLNQQCQKHRKGNRPEVYNQKQKYESYRQQIDTFIILRNRVLQILCAGKIACNLRRIPVIRFTNFVKMIYLIAPSFFHFFRIQRYNKPAVMFGIQL